jgi:CRISPR/Cas system-associated endoribonuclease Cas2
MKAKFFREGKEEMEDKLQKIYRKGISLTLVQNSSFWCKLLSMRIKLIDMKSEKIKHESGIMHH